MNKQTNSALAHILTLLSGFAVSLGLIEQDIVNELTGHIVAACGAITGIITIIVRMRAKKK